MSNIQGSSAVAAKYDAMQRGIEDFRIYLSGPHFSGVDANGQPVSSIRVTEVLRWLNCIRLDCIDAAQTTQAAQ